MSDQAALDRVDGLLALGRPEQALREAGAVLARDPGSDDAHRLVGEALLQLDRWDDLAPHAAEAIAAFPDCEWAWRLHALAQAHLGAADDAISAARRLRSLDGESLTALMTFASVTSTLGRAAEGLPATRRAREIAPDDPDVILAHAAQLWSAGRARDARAAVHEALRIDPQHEHGRDLLTLMGARRQPVHDLIDAARRTSRSPDTDGENEALFELASSRVLLLPAAIVGVMSLLVVAMCVVSRGLLGWRIDIGLSPGLGVLVQILTWFIGATAVLVWSLRVRRELGKLLHPIVESRMSRGALSMGAALLIAGTLVLTAIGLVLYASAGDPVGTVGLLLGLASAYGASVLVAIFQLVPRGRLPRTVAVFPVLMVILSPAIVAGLVLAALAIVGGTLYVVLWAFSGGRLPDLVPDADTAEKQRSTGVPVSSDGHLATDGWTGRPGPRDLR